MHLCCFGQRGVVVPLWPGAVDFVLFVWLRGWYSTLLVEWANTYFAPLGSPRTALIYPIPAIYWFSEDKNLPCVVVVPCS